jgi:DNA-directed RNA polymerase specialized sigma24 family protein
MGRRSEQDVFATLVLRLPTFAHDGQHSFRAWLRTVLNIHRRNLVRRQPAALPEEEPADDRPDGVEELAGLLD